MNTYKVDAKNKDFAYITAFSPQEAAQKCSDKKLKPQPSETHWTKENALDSLTSDAFLVEGGASGSRLWYIFYPQLRAVKVSLSDGNSFSTEMAHNPTDEQILDYYKIGQKINMGKGEHDYFTTISDVKILQ